MNNISSGYNINKMALSVVTIFMEIVFKLTRKQNLFLWVWAEARNSEVLSTILNLEALPTILKHKVFRVVNINWKTTDRIRSCKRLEINEQREVWFIYLTVYLRFSDFCTKISLSTFFTSLFINNIY